MSLPAVCRSFPFIFKLCAFFRLCWVSADEPVTLLYTHCRGTVTFFNGSGSDFWQVAVPGPASYLDRKKQFSKIKFCKNLEFFNVNWSSPLLPRNLSSHLLWFSFISSGLVINYCSGSYGSTVFPQHCLLHNIIIPYILNKNLLVDLFLWKLLAIQKCFYI